MTATVDKTATSVRWVVHAPKSAQKRLIGHLIRVIDDFYGFAMLGAAIGDSLIGWVLLCAAHKAGNNAGNAGNFFKIGFRAPKTATGKIGGGHIGTLGAQRRGDDK